MGGVGRSVAFGPPIGHYFAASNSFRASSAPLKPIFECVPSQNGFVVDAPHRHREIVGFP
jgi:hypothetical protein